MNSNIKKVVLDNGLEIILLQNKNKHRTTFSINVLAGGLNTKYLLDGKEISFPYGTAHVLEHYLIEKSIYGNIGEIFSNDYISSNGMTSYRNTMYYINTIHDFEETFIKLINIVNDPIFNNEDLEGVKRAILEEINKNNDKVGREFANRVYENTFQNKVFDANLGTASDVKNINIDTLRMFHKLFYKPSNERIFIAGNFDDNIVNKIKEIYDNFSFSKDDGEIIKLKENSDVNKKYDVICDPTIKDNMVKITYKIDISDFSPLERDKLDYYLGYLYDSRFSEHSSLFSYLINNKLTLYSIDGTMNPNIIDNYIIASLTVYTDEIDRVIELIKKEMKDISVNEDDFNRWKNKEIIRSINNLEDPFSIMDNVSNNYMLYNLCNYDDIEFLKSLNAVEYLKLIKSICNSDYTITVNKIRK